MLPSKPGRLFRTHDKKELTERRLTECKGLEDIIAKAIKSRKKLRCGFMRAHKILSQIHVRPTFSALKWP